MSGPQSSWRIKSWEVLGRIARGSTAEVLLARPAAAVSQRVVLKRLYPHLAADDDFVRMFADEARLLSLWHHRGIVGVFDLDDDDETFFAVLELVDGPSLSAALRLFGRPLPLDLAAAIGARVAEALDVVHTTRDPQTHEPLLLVHRDVNPHNVLLGRDGAVKLSDFGVARSAAGRKSGLLTAHDTSVGAIKGTRLFLSPEQLRGAPLDPRSDLFSLGIVLYQMLTGVSPFAGDSDVASLDALLHKTPPLPSTTSEASRPLDDLVMALLDKEPARRPTSAEARAALQAHRATDDDSNDDNDTDAAIAGFVVGLGLPSLRA